MGDEAWREIRQYDEIQSADFGPQFGSGGRCNHAPDAPHNKGEWIGAEIRLQTPPSCSSTPSLTIWNRTASWTPM